MHCHTCAYFTVLDRPDITTPVDWAWNTNLLTYSLFWTQCGSVLCVFTLRFTCGMLLLWQIDTHSEDPQCVVISSVNMLVCFLAQEPSCLVSNSKPSSLPGGFVLSRIRPMLLWTTHTYHEIPREHDDEDDDDDCFYVALFSALEQTQCTHMWFYMND